MKGIHYHQWRWLTTLVGVALLQRLSSPARAGDTQWFKLDGIPEPSAGLEVEGSSENINVGGSKSTYDTLFITPTIGLRGSGSIYHPNLATFDFNTEWGWGWNWLSTTGPGVNQTIDENNDLSRYQLHLHLLDSKPYNATFSASKDQTYADYGSFETFEVDTERYDGHMVWDQGKNLCNLDFGYRDETDSGLMDSSEVRENYLNFFGVNQRRTGQTTLTARWDSFDNILGVGTFTSLTENAGLSDVENFGAHQQITLATGASASHSEYGSQQTDGAHANGNLSVHHTPTLDSFLTFNYDYNQMHPADQSVVQGSAGVHHQLYESLSSTLDGHGSYQQDNDGAGGTADSDRFGVGVAEGYAKRLQSWGRLNVGGSVIADHLDQSYSTSVIEEPHQLSLPTNGIAQVYLNRPLVIPGSIQVVTTSGQALLDADFTTIVVGQLTQIQLVDTSHVNLLLQQTNTSLSVLVSYQTEALPNSAANAAYESVTAALQVRMDINGGFGLYGRLNWMDNDASQYVLAETLTDWVGGADYTWRWLRLGAEYEDYDSNFNQYKALRFYQNAAFTLDRRSSLSVNLNETFYRYQQGGDQSLYMLTTRYNVQLWSSLSCYIQGGANWQEIGGSDQLAGSAQTGFSWARGKLTVRAGYEYNDLTLSYSGYTEERDKSRVFAYLKRTF